MEIGDRVVAKIGPFDYGKGTLTGLPGSDNRYNKVVLDSNPGETYFFWDSELFPEFTPEQVQKLYGIGLGGAPTRATTLPLSAEDRKRFPVASGVLDYFPDALVAIAEVSNHGNEQHNPGQPLHWAREKSTDQSDTIIRHFLQRGSFDSDGLAHSAKMAWRALALLQLEIEQRMQEGWKPK